MKTTLFYGLTSFTKRRRDVRKLNFIRKRPTKKVRNSMVLKWLNPWAILVFLVIVPGIQAQNGVRGCYFTNQFFGGAPVVIRNDSWINFDWGTASPAAGIPVDHFAVRWSGEIEPLYSEVYTFYVASDDGARLWVNGKRLINNFQQHPTVTNSATYPLLAGHRYLVQMDYYDETAGAVASLAWASPSQSYQIIPANRWFLLVAGSNRPPNAPILLAPMSDDPTVAADDFAMRTEFFSDPDPGDTHACSDWEIWTLNPLERVWSALGTTNLTRVHLRDGTFENSFKGHSTLRLRTTYKLQVRHKDSSGVAATEGSDWSERLFNTAQPLTTLVSQGSVWKYSDSGVSPGTGWNSNTFNDVSWSSGPAQLGVGDGDEETLTCCSSGPRTTTYFRLQFVLTNLSSLSNPVVRLLRDDGGVVYLNGTEIFHDNMPLGTPSYSTLASQTASEAAESYRFYPTNFPVNVLHTGTNTLAVEIHQSSTTSTDLSFDLELLATRIEQEPVLQYTYQHNIIILSCRDRMDVILEEASDIAGPWQEIRNDMITPFTIYNPLGNYFYRLSRW